MMYWILRILEGHAVQFGDRTFQFEDRAETVAESKPNAKFGVHALRDFFVDCLWQRSELEKLKGKQNISDKHTKRYIQVILLRAPTWFVQRFG
jgi:hypothetical protein